MRYAIHALDCPNSLPLRTPLRPAHLARLQALRDAGRLVTAGPFPVLDAPSTEGGVTGTLVVADFDSLADAQAWFMADPYHSASIYQSWHITPYLAVF